MKRIKGRPASAEGRLAKELRVYDYLDSLGIEYERIDHEAAMTMEACREIDLALEATICKNLFFVQPAGDGVLSAADAGGEKV